MRKKKKDNTRVKILFIKLVKWYGVSEGESQGAHKHLGLSYSKHNNPMVKKTEFWLWRGPCWVIGLTSVQTAPARVSSLQHQLSSTSEMIHIFNHSTESYTQIYKCGCICKYLYMLPFETQHIQGSWIPAETIQVMSIYFVVKTSSAFKKEMYTFHKS
jgi:hypothetical protein